MSEDLPEFKIITLSEHSDSKVIESLKNFEDTGLDEPKENIANHPFEFRKKFDIKNSDNEETNKTDKLTHITYSPTNATITTEANNFYVGLDWLNKNTAIQIIPKLDKNKNQQTDVLGMLFSCLKHPQLFKEAELLYDIKFDKPQIRIDKSKDILSPLLILHFLNVVCDIVNKGLKRNYYQVTENLQSRVKGKLLINKTVKLNQLKNKLLYNYCSYERFDYNNIENRLLKMTMLFCRRVLEDYRAKPKFQSQFIESASPIFHYCMPAFDTVDDTVDIRHLKSVKHNAFYKEYKTAITLAKLILQRYGYNIKNTESNITEDTIKVPPHWIDMAKLFELYVYGLLFDSYGKKVKFQKHLNYGEPDFIFSQEKLILDAKYKLRYKDTELENDKYIISDIRQLSGYARDKKLLKIFEIDPDLFSSTVLPCLIIYPDIDSNLPLKNTKLPLTLDSKKTINQFTEFYKLGIRVPMLKL